MKLYLTKLPPFGYYGKYGPFGSLDLFSTEGTENELFTVGKWYEGELTPTIYDPQTLQPAPASYVVQCNDGNYRKVSHEYFITLEEWRERQLNELGIITNV